MSSNLRDKKSDLLTAAARFHGHLGPWLVLGLKAGAYARTKLAASPFELNARVSCPARTPYTCFVDGIQFSSGCTMGKGNISHHGADGCRVEFTRTEDGSHHKDTEARRGSGAGLRLALRPEVWDELHKRTGSGMADAAKLGREFARRRLSDLFTAGPTVAAPGASR
jgi:hypothetical protein